MQIHPRTLRKWPRAVFLSLVAFPLAAAAQTPAEDSSALAQVLKRLDRLEQENRQLTEEIRALRAELALSRAPAANPPGPTVFTDGAQPADLVERMDVEERRLEEQAQTKVESAQHFPIRITGMALFNAFLNSHPNDGLVVPVLAPPGNSAFTGGATLRQTILGLDFRGPEIFGDGRIHGFVNMDFFGGSGEPYSSLVRLRTAGIEVNWENTSVMFGQDKPLISPREPNSLAQVGLSPLTGAGNLWLWQPQIRVEQRLHLNENSTLRAQAGVFATREEYGYVPPAYASSFETVRPAVQGRLSLAHSLGDDRRLEIGTGFSTSNSHVTEVHVPSRVYALDWFANPWRKLEFSGAFFRGSNLANLGGGGQGFTVLNYGDVIPVHASGGWAQLSFLATPRLTFNFFGGEQDNRARDLWSSGLRLNRSYAGNLMYRLAPNVILSLESGQVRTDWLGRGKRLSNYHDLGFAYLF
jgi:hypothetical protein